MNQPMSDPAPEQPGTLHGGWPRTAPPRRPLAAPAGTAPAQPAPYEAAVLPASAEARAHEPVHVEAPEDNGPQPLGPRVEPTGHPPVDVQLRRLGDADHLAVSGHLEVYEDVHRGLRDSLTTLDRHDPHPRS